LFVQGTLTGSPELRVFGASGSMVRKVRLQGGRVDLTGLQPGYYLLEVIDRDGVQRLPFIRE
jgi:hypothetical protein